MEIKGDELGPSVPVSDERLLLAIGRAWDHIAPERTRLHRSQIARHLGFVHNGATTRRLRPQIEKLKRGGYLEEFCKRGARYLRPTGRGERRIAALRRSGDQEPLPESPQHREWRQARNLADERVEEILAELDRALDQARAVRRVSIEDIDGGSKEVRAMGKRLEARFHLLAIAVYCLFEWPEPEEDACDKSHCGWQDLKRDSLFAELYL